MLADVSGSPAPAEQLSALGREGTEVITETLNRYFGTMIRLMSEAGGDLLTFGGDALLVFFEGPDSVVTATATGLALLRELAGFVREVPGVGQFPLTILAYAAYFTAALDLFTAASSTLERARTEARLGEAMALAGDPAAHRHLTAAGATFAAIGASGELQRLAR